jgi:ABC-type polysaccharide transport system permease subunit
VVVRGISGHKMKEQTKEWRKLHKEKFYYMFSLPDIIWLLKLRTIIWSGHVARVEVKKTYKVLLRNLERYLEVDKIIILKGNLKKYNGCGG